MQLVKLLESTPQMSDNAETVVSYDTKMPENVDPTTYRLIMAFVSAYSFFKARLFKNYLGSIILTLNRNSRSAGYYMHSAWIDQSGTIIPEINVHPALLKLPAIEVMGVLVHEMAHHFQAIHGDPGRAGYHNRQFAALMRYFGLPCSETGQPGGRETGQQMSHYILKGGRFETAFNAMPKQYLIPFTSYSLHSHFHPSRNKLKVKYACPHGHLNVWGKPGIQVICGICKRILISN